jgi:hypothetical protein
MQEMNSCTEKIYSELVKVTVENVVLDVEYNKLKHVQDVDAQRVERMQQEFKQV